jgi:transcriptional regulator with XRE-family HTH domain
MSRNKPVTIGDRVRHAREKLGKTQLELANECGVRSETISRIERGRNDAALASLHKIAPALGMTLDELVNGRKPEA